MARSSRACTDSDAASFCTGGRLASGTAGVEAHQPVGLQVALKSVEGREYELVIGAVRVVGLADCPDCNGFRPCGEFLGDLANCSSFKAGRFGDLFRRVCG